MPKDLAYVLKVVLFSDFPCSAMCLKTLDFISEDSYLSTCYITVREK